MGVYIVHRKHPLAGQYPFCRVAAFPVGDTCIKAVVGRKLVIEYVAVVLMVFFFVQRIVVATGGWNISS